MVGGEAVEDPDHYLPSKSSCQVCAMKHWLIVLISMIRVPYAYRGLSWLAQSEFGTAEATLNSHGKVTSRSAVLNRHRASNSHTGWAKILAAVCWVVFIAAADLQAQSPNPQTGGSQAVGTTARVAIYDHSDGSAAGPQNLMQFLTRSEGFECQRVTPAEIQEGILKDFDVLIIPGGSGSLQSKKLEEAGLHQVRQFVKAGGGYVGICAGSYLASTQYSWSLGLINARVWDRAHWARGTGDVQLAMTASGRRLLNEVQPQVKVMYGQGPLLLPDTQPNLPGYEVLAEYQTEVALKGAPEGSMVGTHAIIRSKYGDGRVICFSPHPEKEGGPRHLMLEGVRWAANPSTKQKPHPVTAVREKAVETD
jgi:glutamine amidotransferase-like uncharacterized protein